MRDDVLKDGWHLKERIMYVSCLMIGFVTWGEFRGGGTYKVKMEANFLFLSLVLFERF